MPVAGGILVPWEAQRRLKPAALPVSQESRSPETGDAGCPWREVEVGEACGSETGRYRRKLVPRG